MSGWCGKTERQRMEQLATDGGDHEWGWYQDDVPALLSLLDLLAEALRAADEGHLTIVGDALGRYAAFGREVCP